MQRNFEGLTQTELSKLCSARGGCYGRFPGDSAFRSGFRHALAVRTSHGAGEMSCRGWFACSSRRSDLGRASRIRVPTCEGDGAPGRILNVIGRPVTFRFLNATYGGSRFEGDITPRHDLSRESYCD
ncbi:hypothetical protein Taro_053777 [Colocasia esculenta]|uniref:Uncharacterized protein n=1 Tax=Colocasia esculenta TaxID=4460 RepID=A0A843XM41_COLES|nr:hypothetical protein [Colocasia esculenta]